MEIRKESIEDGENGYLAIKISKLIGFFNLIFGELDEEEKALLEEKLIQVYKLKNINFDDKSLYNEKGEFKNEKQMPILGDLFNILGQDERTKKFKIKLIPFVEGSMKFFNNYSNIKLDNELIVADIYDLGEENLKYGMYILIDIFWDAVKKDRKEIELSIEEQEKAEKNVEKFLKEFLEKTQKDAKYSIEKTSSGLKVNINNENLGFLIGYRGETLYAFQTILSTIASKGTESRVRVVLDIEGYKAKREKALEDLAEKLEKTVIKTKKSVTLEPMQAYERKIIHAKLQNSDKVETRSIGEEPRRRVVISLKRN